MRIISRFRPCLSKKVVSKIVKNICFSSLGAHEEKNRQFEKIFAGYLGVRNVISVPSGRMGLFLILKNLGLEEKSHVLVPSFTYWAVPRMISFLHFEPLFTDIDLKTCTIDSSEIEKNIIKPTRAIVATHLYGLPCPMDEILAVAKRHNLFVVEDCVQAFGAEYKGKKTGSLGDAAYFGFGITKDLFPLGGGIIATNNDILAEKIKKETISYGFLGRPDVVMRSFKAMAMKLCTQPVVFPYFLYPFICAVSFFLGKDIVDCIFEEKEKVFESLPKDGLNLVPHALQSDIGLEQIKHLDSLHNKRIENAVYLLKNLEGIEGITLPFLPKDNTKNIFVNFPLRYEHRNVLARALLKRGIDTSLGYMRAYGASSHNAIALQRSILHIPISPYLRKTELSYIARSIRKAMENIKL